MAILVGMKWDLIALLRNLLKKKKFLYYFINSPTKWNILKSTYQSNKYFKMYQLSRGGAEEQK